MVIPIGDHNPTRRRAWVTWLLIAVNIVVFVVLTPWYGDACDQVAFYQQWGAVPAEVVEGDALGGAEVPAAQRFGCDLPADSDKNAYAGILYAMFLHGGWLHLAFNMLYLAVFGNNVEDRLGHLRYALFYLGGGVLATLAFVFANSSSPVALVGASGAIAAVLGSYLVQYPSARVTVLVPVFFFFVMRLPALLVLGLWFVLQLFELQATALTGGNVAYLAHVAGFVVGALLTLLLGFRPQRPRRARRSYNY